MPNAASYLPPGPPNGAHKPGVHPAGYPMPRAPLSPFHGGPLSQPYAIPTRGAVHGPVGAVPHVPQPGSRGFGAGRGNAGAPIGSHLPHQQGTQQNVGNLGSTFNFPALENPNSQPSVGGPLSQPGFVNNVRIVLSFFYVSISPQFLYFHLLDACILILIVCNRCHKGQAKHFVMDFPWRACLRFFSC